MEKRMAKFKHNKKRNSAFLYEVLIQELTKSVISKNKEIQSKVTSLIKEYFSRDSMMYRELKLYHAIVRTKDTNVLTAEKILNEVKSRHKGLDKKKLLSEQNKLSRRIRKFVTEEAFSNFVPNYKDLASIAQIFNNKISVRSKVLLENELIDKMSSKKNEEKMTPINNLVFKSFAKKFNEEYSDKLLAEQKILLNKFITSFHNNGLELKTYLNEEIGRLKGELEKSFLEEEFISDPQMLLNAKKVMKILESCKDKKPDKEMVEEIIKIQGLVQEIRTGVS
tara:strand:+ start:564 stop:1403 length:840 start_codon:yes stop_codon:yes gene_type:complete